RLRFHSDSDLITTLAKLHANLHQARQDGLLWRVQSDDYVLEAERYGGAASLALCEQLFCIDSGDVFALLEIEEEFSGMHQRWLYALISIDYYAQALFPGEEERTEFIEKIANNYISEHSSPSTRSSVQVSLGARFRDLRKSIDVIRRGSPAVNAWREYLQARLAQRESVIAAIRELIKDLPKERSDSVWHSLMHMHSNRLVQSDPRRHEAVLYDFTRRLERARQAAKRSNVNQAVPANQVRQEAVVENGQDA
ncbi:MAG: thiopeptide-type bacteriocin biosynthesis protein, partial [Undibacterium sp.]|nr:thiopeptide-type bacteriocin biosynthesis protein [Undibacterium sp.]